MSFREFLLLLKLGSTDRHKEMAPKRPADPTVDSVSWGVGLGGGCARRQVLVMLAASTRSLNEHGLSDH